METFFEKHLIKTILIVCLVWISWILFQFFTRPDINIINITRSNEDSLAMKQADEMAAEYKKSQVQQNSLDSVSKLEYKKLLKHFNVKKDEFTSSTFYTHKDADEENSNYFYIYLVYDERPYTRLKIQYHGDNWIFADDIKFNIDGEVYNMPLYDSKTDVAGGVYEWWDLYLEDSRDKLELMNNIGKSKKAKYQLSGKYSKNYTFTQSQKKSILETIQLRNYLLKKYR